MLIAIKHVHWPQSAKTPAGKVVAWPDDFNEDRYRGAPGELIVDDSLPWEKTLIEGQEVKFKEAPKDAEATPYGNRQAEAFVRAWRAETGDEPEKPKARGPKRQKRAEPVIPDLPEEPKEEK